MEAIAKTRHLKGSPRKARLVIDLIRGRNVSQALNILKFTDKRAAEPITKTLRSAIANATYLAEQQNIAIDPDDLFVKTCFVDMGAHKNRRRMRPAPQGRAFREQRHYCHITILVSSDVPVAKDEDVLRKKGKKLLAKEAQAAETKTKTTAVKTEKKSTVKAQEVREESDLAVTVATPIVAEEIKSAKAETVRSDDAVETTTVEAEALQVVTETETTAVADSTAEQVEDKKIVIVEEPELETAATEDTVKSLETVEAEEPLVKTAEVETLKAGEAKPETAEAGSLKLEEISEAEKAKLIDVEADSILKVNSPKSDAKGKTDKQKAEASDAKNVQPQTSAERNETKKADNAQPDDNDILELK